MRRLIGKLRRRRQLTAVVAALAISGSALAYPAGAALIDLKRDEAIRDRVDQVASRPLLVELVVSTGLVSPFELDDQVLAIQLVDAEGETVTPPGQEATLPVTEDELAVAAGDSPEALADVAVGEEEGRMITVPLKDGQALQVAASLDRAQAALTTIAVASASVALMAIAALGVALAPVRRARPAR